MKRDSVLIIEDTKEHARLIDQLLRSESYETMIASNSAEGLALCSKYQGSLGVVCLDIRLSEHEIGLDIVGDLRDLDPNVVIVVVTAFGDDPEYRDKARQKGVFDFVTKGAEFPDRLRVAVAEAFRFRSLTMRCVAFEEQYEGIEDAMGKGSPIGTTLKEMIAGIGSVLEADEFCLHVEGELAELTTLLESGAGTDDELPSGVKRISQPLSDWFTNDPQVCWTPAEDSVTEGKRIYDLDREQFPMRGGTLWIPMAPMKRLLGVVAVGYQKLPYTPRLIVERWCEFCELAGIHLLASVNRALSQQKKEADRKKKQLEDDHPYFLHRKKTGSWLKELVGSSTCMQEVKEMIRKVATAPVSVLITGESGTGKELVAQAIHELSQQRKGPFVAVNCSAIPRDLWEGQLFGHEKGAYTSAHNSRIGLIEAATDGTLFLDEVGDMPNEMRPKLLRFLQEKTFRPVGAVDEKHSNARILAATKFDLAQEVEKGNFREDLFHRLDQFHIRLPPLCQRGDDVIEIADQLLEREQVKHGKRGITFHPDAHKLLREHEWGIGNVRELEKVIIRCIVFLESEQQITTQELGHLSSARTTPVATGTPMGYPGLKATYDEWAKTVDGDVSASLRERLWSRIILVFHRNEWNKVKTASELGISRGTLDKYLKSLDISEQSATAYLDEVARKGEAGQDRTG